MSCTNGSKVVSKFGGLQTDILEKLWIVKCWIFGALNGHRSHQFLLCLGLNEGSWYPSPEQWKFGRWAVWGLENHWDHCGMFVISLSPKKPLEEIHYPPSLCEWHKSNLGTSSPKVTFFQTSAHGDRYADLEKCSLAQLASWRWQQISSSQSCWDCKCQGGFNSLWEKRLLSMKGFWSLGR